MVAPVGAPFGRLTQTKSGVCHHLWFFPGVLRLYSSPLASRLQVARSFDVLLAFLLRSFLVEILKWCSARNRTNSMTCILIFKNLWNTQEILDFGRQYIWENNGRHSSLFPLEKFPPIFNFPCPFYFLEYHRCVRPSVWDSAQFTFLSRLSPAQPICQTQRWLVSPGMFILGKLSGISKKFEENSNYLENLKMCAFQFMIISICSRMESQ